MDPQAASEQYRRDGYAVLRNVISTDLIEEAAEHVEWLRARYPELRPEEFHHPLIRHDAFWVRLVTDERLLNIGEAVLGPNLACLTAHFICKPPYDGQAVLWHQDGSYWKLEPMEALTIWLAIDRSTPDNGCLRVIPGSHEEPLHAPELRHDVPNMLRSATRQKVVDEWIARREIVDIVLEPGDVSIHHPNILHCSEANGSPYRRCGLDIGLIPTGTRVSNEGLYLDALLVRGVAVAGVNRYRAYPRFDERHSMRFIGCEGWNDKADAINERGLFHTVEYDESPLRATKRMISRLQEGTVKR